MAEKTKMPKAIFKDFIDSPAKIGQATCDEKGHVIGGKAGDQTKAEVAISKYSYSTSGAYHWVYVFRAKKKKARLKIADACVKACKNDHVGYDASSPARKSFFKEAKKVKFEIDKVKKDCETTCSELANVCVAAAGLKSYLEVNQQANVETLRKALQSGGEFKRVKLNVMTLQPGDILIGDCHTAVVVKSVLRPGEVSQRVYDFQSYLDWYFDGEFFKECGKPDYKYGNNTLKWCKKMQTKFFGAKEADGSIGPRTLKKMKAVKK